VSIILDIFRHANLILHRSATIGSNLLTVAMFSINSFPVVYRTMFMVPNTMLMNVMACRVFRNTRFGDGFTESTTATRPSGCRPAPNDTLPISAISFREPYTNPSATRALSLVSETDNQSTGGRGTIDDEKL
jgi:hypothetical protein